jgi:hypothetical protein
VYGRDGAALRPASDRFDRAGQSGRRAFSAFRQPAPPRSSPFPELDALRRRFPAAFITWVERRASALGLGADRVLVAQRAIAEEDYLRSYAVTSGIAFEPLDRIPRVTCPLGDDRMLDAIAAGILPFMIAGRLTFIVAPRGTAARRMLEFARRYSGLRFRFRVTSAQRLQDYILRHCGRALGRRAAYALRSAAPEFSAAPGVKAGTGRWLTIFAALAAAGFIAVPDEALAVTNIAVSLLFLAWMTIRLLGVFIAPPDTGHARRIADANLPIYTVIAALYREAKSVAGLVAALRLIDWPPEKLDIKLVVEADDFETRAAIARLDLPPWFDVIVAPPVGPRTKPKALNAALPLARGTFTVVYDAEDRPDPQGAGQSELPSQKARHSGKDRRPANVPVAVAQRMRGVAMWTKGKRTYSSCPGTMRSTSLVNPSRFFRCVCRKLDSAILVMKTPEHGSGCDGAGPLNGAMNRTILVQSPMGAHAIVIGRILTKDPAQVSFAEHNQVVDAFPSDRADQSLRVPILPWRPGRDRLVPNAHGA